MKNNVKISTILKVAIPLVILIVLIVLKATVFSSDEFSLARYAIVTIEGPDTRAGASAYLDDVGLYNALAGENASDEEKNKYKPFVDSIRIVIDREENLSNGDVIEVLVEYDRAVAKELGIRVDLDSRHITVKDLMEGRELDLFADVKIITGGISPYVYAAYINESEDEYLSRLEYKIDKTSNLSIGDEITITCLIDEANAAGNGYYYDETKMQYTIVKADKYIDSPEELDTKVIEGLGEECIEVIVNETNDTTYHMSYRVTGSNEYLYRDNNEKAVGFEYYGTVLANNNTGFEQKHENYVLVFYRGSIALPTYTTEEDPYDYIDAYFCFIYSDAILTKDGEFLMATNEPENRFVCGSSYENTLAAVEEYIGKGYAMQDLK